MTGNTKTIQQIRDEIVIILSGLNCINDCFTEFDDQLKVNKIVILVTSLEYDSKLRVLLKQYVSCGHRIVFRQAPEIFPF